MFSTLISFAAIVMVVIGTLFLVAAISKGHFRGEISIKFVIWKLFSLEVGVDKKNK